MHTTCDELGTWSGRVLERMDAMPVSNVVVRLLDPNGRELKRTRTDQNGLYALTARTGVAVVEVCVPGGQVVDRMVACRSSSKEKRIKDLHIDSRTRLPVYLVTRDVASGQPARNATVLIMSERGDRTFLETRTDSSGVGRGEIAGIRVGRDPRVQVVVNKEGYYARAVVMAPEDLALCHWDLAGQSNGGLVPIEVGEDVKPPVLPVR